MRLKKAHSKILDIFLQVFDNGFLTDSHGVRCDFRETVIIMTSNIGVSKKDVAIGFGGTDRNQDKNSGLHNSIVSEARRLFRPEFINRLTDIVVFDALAKNEVKGILDLIVARMAERLRPKGIQIVLSDEVEEMLMNQGYSETFGARHLERTVENAVAKPLSDCILSGKVPSGSVVEVVVREGCINLNIKSLTG